MKITINNGEHYESPHNKISRMPIGVVVARSNTRTQDWEKTFGK